MDNIIPHPGFEGNNKNIVQSILHEEEVDAGDSCCSASVTRL